MTSRIPVRAATSPQPTLLWQRLPVDRAAEDGLTLCTPPGLCCNRRLRPAQPASGPLPGSAPACFSASGRVSSLVTLTGGALGVPWIPPQLHLSSAPTRGTSRPAPQTRGPPSRKASWWPSLQLVPLPRITAAPDSQPLQERPHLGQAGCRDGPAPTQEGHQVLWSPGGQGPATSGNPCPRPQETPLPWPSGPNRAPGPQAGTAGCPKVPQMGRDSV